MGTLAIADVTLMRNAEQTNRSINALQHIIWGGGPGKECTYRTNNEASMCVCDPHK